MYSLVFLSALLSYTPIKCELSCWQIKDFVDTHNNLRLKLAKGEIPNQPAASEMKYMVWDEELAAKAAKWAAANVIKHNPDRSVDSKRFTTGENIYWTATPDLSFKFEPKKAVKAWFSEYKDYTYEPLESSHFDPNNKMIGHYTQVVWSNSIYIGCGISKVKKDGWNNFYVVCNYGPPGNFLGSTPYPTNGKASGHLVCPIDSCSRLYGDKC